MQTYRINVHDRNSAIPFPNTAKKNDIAYIYFATKTPLQLVHKYIFNGKTWDYKSFELMSLN